MNGPNGPTWRSEASGVAEATGPIGGNYLFRGKSYQIVVT